MAAVAFGLAAARPAAAGANANTAYFATDTGEVTFSDGAAWHNIHQVAGDGIPFHTGTTLVVDGGGSVQATGGGAFASTPLYVFSGTSQFLFSGAGVPAAGLGNNNDLYFRTDGAAGATIYQKRAGAWVATNA